MTMKVAILGANGFVGHRLFETWQTGPGSFSARAIVRAPGSLARIARFHPVDWRIADAQDAAALTQAFAGCEAVVHCVVGDERMIAATLDPVCRAAKEAGVQRLVYLSSASVHGQNPPQDTTESSSLSDCQPFAYNNAKVKAERRLRAHAQQGGLPTLILRPGIVFGPRSRWIGDLADALVEKRAWWIDGGRGICNSIYVDNLVHAIERALVTPAAGCESFLVGDSETVRWRDLYLGVANGLGMGETDFVEAKPAQVRPVRTWRDRLHGFKSTPAAQAVLPWFSPRLKGAVKAALASWNASSPPNLWEIPRTSTLPPVADVEMTLLFACRTKLPSTKAERLLLYAPPVSFAEGMGRCVAWLKAVGYPVRTKVGLTS